MIQWTAEQEKAISFQSQGELLVSAAAGSGKTAVLTERILRTCLEGRAALSELAVMTFTDKAAVHMRRALEKNIHERLAETEDSAEREKLRELVKELPLAQISTIHAFCLRLIREYRHELSDEKGELLLDGHFSVISGEDLGQLKEEVLDDILHEAYSAVAALEKERHDAALGKKAEPATGKTDACEVSSERGAEADSPGRTEMAPPATWAGDGLLAQISLMQEAGRATWLDSFALLSDLLSGDKSDQGFREALLDFVEFLSSLPDPRDFCREAMASLIAEAQDFCSGAAAAEALTNLRKAALRAAQAQDEIEALPYFAELMSPPAKKSSQEKLDFQTFYPMLLGFINDVLNSPVAHSQASAAAADSDSSARRKIWNSAVDEGKALQNWKTLSRNAKNEEKNEFRQNFYQGFGPLLNLLGLPFSEAICKEFGLETAGGLFSQTVEEIEEAARDALPLSARFLELALLFQQELLRRKLKRRQIDFSDQEHLALRLLRQPKVAAAVSGRIKEILIDEYQDSSLLQEAMIQAIGARQIYMVGDIKQSIYRFRHADPSLFGSKLETFVAAEKLGEHKINAAEQEASERPVTQPLQRTGVKLLLNKNFRSAPRLLLWINRFFASFLTKESGQIDYDESQALQPGRELQKLNEEERKKFEPRLELRFLLKDEGPETSKENPEPVPALIPEPLQKANPRALALLDTLLDLRKAGWSYGDIAVLCRTNARCEEARQVLESCGLPYAMGLTKVLISSVELRLLQQLVAHLANFARDFPLAAVLRSSLHGEPFQEDELFKIAAFRHVETTDLCDDKDELEGESLPSALRPQFFERFLAYAESGEDRELRARCQAYLEQYWQWRQMASVLPLADLLTRIVEQSHWLERLSALPYAGQRLNDWESFISWTEEFERLHGPDLANFARSLNEIRTQNLAVEGLSRSAEEADAVKILTEHNAKGLEFPVVILYDLSSSLRRPGARQNFFRYRAEEGLAQLYLKEQPDGLRLIEGARSRAFRLHEDFAERSEDFRLLYVAMTRAEERLILLGSSQTTKIEELAGQSEAAVEEGRKRGGATSRLALPPDFAQGTDNEFSLLAAWAAGELPGLPEALRDLPSRGSFSLVKEDFRVSGVTLTQLLAELSPKLLGTAGVSAEQETAAGTGEKQPSELLHALSEDRVYYPETAADLLTLRELLSPRLPHEELLNVPSKLTVSALSEAERETATSLSAPLEGEGRLLDREESPAEAVLYPEAMQEMALLLRRPNASLCTKPTDLRAQVIKGGAAYGTLMHRIFQHLPVGTLREAELKGELPQAFEHFLKDELRLSALSEEESEFAATALPQIRSFLRSELTEELAAAEQKAEPAWRELPFTLAVPARGLADPEGEITLVQGMIDLAFRSRGEIVLLDYKSDRLRGSRAERDAELLRRYRLQLACYAEAIRRIQGQKVGRILLWLIREGRAVDFSQEIHSELLF
ncbi:MAG: UvrD-helicase domain-containing protein [Clostridiales bacterium]|nr:UvrD-helicase domain-containing protein [Clostridiales bacterium]MDD7431815.1 UvrD-helicase domain-containing protein [Clostridiales bacterium]MDY3062384.1 UvrD-helicase domain-containing protein [Eubacteriales bacterium]